MELWFTEDQSPNVRFSVKVDRQVYTKQSRFQRIDIFDSLEFGRIMTLDGLMMVTQKDEFIYHDMIVHVPMATNPDIKHVLLIGAGDGGAVFGTWGTGRTGVFEVPHRIQNQHISSGGNCAGSLCHCF